MISMMFSFKYFPKMSTEIKHAFLMGNSSDSSFGAMMYAIDAPISTVSKLASLSAFFHNSQNSPGKLSFAKTPTVLPPFDALIISINLLKLALSLSFCK